MACDDKLDVIRRRLDTLPMATRAVFLLLRFDALDYGQIAWRLGIGIEEVERHVSRAMLELRCQFTKYTYYAAPGAPLLLGTLKAAPFPTNCAACYANGALSDRRHPPSRQRTPAPARRLFARTFRPSRSKINKP